MGRYKRMNYEGRKMEYILFLVGKASRNSQPNSTGKNRGRKVFNMLSYVTAHYTPLRKAS